MSGISRNSAVQKTTTLQAFNFFAVILYIVRFLIRNIIVYLYILWIWWVPMDTHRWKLYSRFWIGNTAGMVQENATFKEIILSSGSGYWIRSVGNEFATFILVDTHSLIYFFF
jgi:hypothetical protein